MPPEDDDSENQKRKDQEPDTPERQDAPERDIRPETLEQVHSQVMKTGIEARDGLVATCDQFGNPVQSTNRLDPIRSTRVKSDSSGTEHTHSFYPSGVSMGRSLPAEMKVTHAPDGSSAYVVRGLNGETEALATVRPGTNGGLEINSSRQGSGELAVRTDANGNLTEFSRNAGNVQVTFRPELGPQAALQINGRPCSELPAEKVQAAMQLISQSVSQLADSLGLSINIQEMQLQNAGADPAQALRSIIEQQDQRRTKESTEQEEEEEEEEEEEQDAEQHEHEEEEEEAEQEEEEEEETSPTSLEQDEDSADPIQALEETSTPLPRNQWENAYVSAGPLPTDIVSDVPHDHAGLPITPADKPSEKPLDKPTEKPEARDVALPQDKPIAADQLRPFQALSPQLSPEFVRALASGDAQAISRLAEANPEMARLAANSLVARVTGGPPDADTTRMLAALGPLTQHMSAENAAALTRAMPTIRSIMFPERRDSAQEQALDNAVNNIYTNMLTGSNADVQRAALQHFATGTWYGADRDRVVSNILPLLNSSDNATKNLAGTAIRNIAASDSRILSNLLNNNENPAAQAQALDTLLLRQASGSDAITQDVTRLASSTNPEVRDRALALLLSNRGRGDSTTVPEAVSTQLSQMQPEQLQALLARGTQGATAADFLKGLQSLISTSFGPEGASMRRNVSEAVLAVAQRSQHSPELYAQFGRTLLASREGTQALRQDLIRNVGTPNQSSMSMLLNAAAGNDTAASKAQETLLSILRPPGGTPGLNELLNDGRQEPSIGRLLNPDTIDNTVRNSVRDSIFRAAQNRPELLGLASAAALGQDRISAGTPQEQINRLTDAAANGNRNALNLLTTMARQVNEQTPTDSANRMALTGLLNLASRTDVQNRLQVNEAVLSLAGRNAYLREQSLQGLISSGGDRVRAVAVMAAIASGELLVPADPTQLLERMPTLIRGSDNVQAQQAAQVLAIAAQLPEGEGSVGNRARQVMQGLLSGLQNDAAGQQTLRTIINGALNAGNDISRQFFSSLGFSLNNDAMRRQAVDILRTQLREAPQGATAQQDRLADALQSAVNSFRPLRLDDRAAESNHARDFLGPVSPELLARAREGDRRAQLEIQAYGVEAIRHLSPDNAVDRQIFSNIAARHLEQVAARASFTPQDPLLIPIGSRQTVQGEWNRLLTQFTGSPQAHPLMRPSLAQQAAWEQTQLRVQAQMVEALRQRAQGADGEQAMAALAQLIPPPPREQLLSTPETRHNTRLNAELGRAAREALIGVANTPERQNQVFEQLMQNLGRNYQNSEVLRAAAELAARNPNLPAERLNLLTQYITATLLETRDSMGTVGARRRFDALAGAAALMAAGHQMPAEVVEAGRTLAGRFADQFRNASTDNSRGMQGLMDSMTALSPFMTPQQIRQVLESAQARGMGAARIVDEQGNDVSNRYGNLFLLPGQRLSMEPGPLQNSFGNFVRSLINSNNPETQLAVMRYSAENLHVATAGLTPADRQAFLTRVQSLARSDNNEVREAATAVLNRAMDTDAAFRTQMLNHSEQRFRQLAVESFFRNGGTGLAANAENAGRLLAIAQDQSAPPEVRQHARALLLPMVAPGGLSQRDPVHEQITGMLTRIINGPDALARQQLVNDAVFLAQQNRSSNNDSIAGLTALAGSSARMRQQLSADLLTAYQNNAPVRTEGDQNPGLLRQQTVARALEALGAFPREGADPTDRSFLEQQARSNDAGTRNAAIAMLAFAATDTTGGANTPARQRAEQALFNLIGEHRYQDQTLQALNAMARGEGPSAQQATDLMVRMALRDSAFGGTADQVMNQVMSLARQNLDGSGRLPSSSSETIRLLEQAGIAGNARAIEALGRISSGSDPSSRNALESIIRIIASHPPNHPTAQSAQRQISTADPDRAAAISHAVNSAFRTMPEAMQARMMENGYFRSVLQNTAVRELTGTYTGDARSLRTIAGSLAGNPNRFATTEGAIDYLARNAASSPEALSLLIAAASRNNGSAESRETNRLASARLAELAGITLGPSDRNAPDGGFTAAINALHQRALSGNPEAMRILIQAAADPSVPPNLRQLSMEAMRETLRSAHANLAVDQILSAWRTNPSTTMLGVLAAASAELPHRTDLQQRVRDGYLNAMRREEGMSDEQYRLRSQTAALALLSNPNSLTPELIREVARHMTPEMASMLMRAEHVPADKMRQLLSNLREVAANPPAGTNIAAVAQAMGNLARIATPQDVSALASLRDRPGISTQDLEAVNRALFTTATQARDIQVRSAAFQSFENSAQFRGMPEGMQNALREFARTGESSNLAELRNAHDRILGTSTPYPLAVSMAMYMNVIRPDGSLAPSTGRPSDREISQMANQIMSRFEYGDSRSISGYVLPVMAAAFERYGGINGRPPERDMIVAVMQNLANDGRLTDARFRDLERVDRNENVRNWQDHRAAILNEISQLTQELQRTGSNLLQSHENHQRLMDAYNRARERNANWQQLGAPPPLPPRPTEQQLRDQQGNIVSEHQRMINRLAELYGSLGQADGWLQQAHIQRTPAEYNELRAQGRHVEASTLLLQRWGEGRLPASLESELSRSWQQLYENGLVPHRDMPRLSTAADGYDYLARMRQSGMDPAIANALTERALRVIREGEFSPEAQRRLQSVGEQFQARSAALLNAFTAIVALGRRDETLSNFVRNELNELKTMLNSPETQELRGNLSTALDNMRAQLRGMEAGSPGHQSLQLQISQMETLHNMLDPNGQYVRNLDTLERGLRQITPDSWGQQLASTLAQVAVATAMFAAATAISVATFGAGTPAAVAMCLVLTPVLLTAGSQVTQEVLYQAGGTNQSTPFMNYVVGRTQFDPQTRSFVPTQAGEAWSQLGQQFVQEAIMNTVTMGAGSLGRVAMGRVLGAGAVAHAAPALTGNFAQRFGTVFRQNYTAGAHVIGMGLAAPGLVNEDLGRAMMIVGPMFAFGHSAFSTYRESARNVNPTRPAISRPAELIENLNLGNMNEQQRAQLREWWGSRPAAEQARIAEAFRFIPPGEDVRVIQALRSASPQQIGRLTEAMQSNRTPAHSSAFLREFANLPQEQRTQLLSTLDGLSSTQRANLVARLSEAAAIDPRGDRTPGAQLAGNPMSRLVSDIVNAGPNRSALVDRIISLPAPLVAEIANLPVQELRGRALETLSASNRATTFNTLIESMPPHQRPEFLRSLTMIESPQARAQVVDRLASHANGAEIAAAIGGMGANRRNALEALGSMPAEQANRFMSILGSAGDRQARTSLLSAIAELPAQRRTEAIEAVIAGGNQQWGRMSRLNDVQMRQELNSLLRPVETTPAPPVARPEPRAITPEQQTFINAVSGVEARQARQRLVDLANEAHIDLPLNRLGGVSQTQIAQLQQLLGRARDLHNGPLPVGITEAQRNGMLRGIEAMLSRSGNNRGINYENVESGTRVLDAILGGRTEAFTNQHARHLADILTASRNVPPELFPPFERLMQAEPAGLARYANVLEQLSGMTIPRSDTAAWQATQRIQQLLNGSPLGRDWAFLPAARGAVADQMGMDGAFINLRTGEVRPVDFKTNNQTGRWIMNIDKPSQSITEESIGQFLERSRPYALSPQFLNEVGMPPFGASTTPAGDLAALNNYLRRVNDYVARERAAGRPPSAQFQELITKFENARPTLHGRVMLRERVPELLTPLLEGQPSAYGKDGTSHYVEYNLPENFHANYTGTRGDGTPHIQNQHINRIRVHQDGRIEGVAGTPPNTHTWEVGNVRDIYQNAITQLQSQPQTPAIQGQIQGLQDALGRLTDRRTFIRPNAGRQGSGN